MSNRVATHPGNEYGKKRRKSINGPEFYIFLWRDFCRVKLLSKSVFSGSSTHFSGHGAYAEFLAAMYSSICLSRPFWIFFWKLFFFCRFVPLLSSYRRLALDPIRPWCRACSHLALRRERRHFLASGPERRHLVHRLGQLRDRHHDHRDLLESVCYYCCELYSVESLSPSVSSIELIRARFASACSVLSWVRGLPLNFTLVSILRVSSSVKAELTRWTKPGTVCSNSGQVPGADQRVGLVVYRLDRLDYSQCECLGAPPLGCEHPLVRCHQYGVKVVFGEHLKN